MDPAEAVAHLVAHDIRAPIFLAAELLRMTADDRRDDDALAAVIERLDAVVNGLVAAGAVCDDVVASLRPTSTDPAHDSVQALVDDLWPSAEVVVDGSTPPTPLLGAVLADLATAAPAPSSVRVDLRGRGHCQVRSTGIEDSRDACLALARAARRVRALELRGGEFRVGRDGNEFVIDVRFPEGADA
jgi:hypothetical protein